jgi:hypothetical protein
MTMQTIDNYKKNLEDSIVKENPQISSIDLKIEVFKRFYEHDFSEEKKEDIVKEYRKYLSK